MLPVHHQGSWERFIRKDRLAERRQHRCVKASIGGQHGFRLERDRCAAKFREQASSLADDRRRLIVARFSELE